MSVQNIIKLSFSEYEPQLLNLAKHNLNPALARRVSPEDVVQETLLTACDKIDYFNNNPEVPVYCKLRKLMFQTISNLERTHLKSQKRDICKEIYINDDGNCSSAQLNWNMFADSITSPSLKVSEKERCELLENVMKTLSESDRQIIELRNFDGMSNSETAQVLHLTEKNASIRYVRALQKLKKLLSNFSEI